MRIKKNTKRKSTADNTHFGRISKNSIKKDFKDRKEKKEYNEPPAVGAKKRIQSISEKSEYYKYQRFIIGKLVVLKEQSTVYSGLSSWVCSFAFEEDRLALNKAAGWTMKDEYLFDGIKFQ